MNLRVCVLVVSAACACYGQRLFVYSPLTRVDPAGEVIKADRGSNPPRHILSPGVPRNAYSSLRIAVELDKPGPFFLEIAQNPENAVTATLYKEHFVETADGWIPDSLQQVAIPYRGTPGDFRLPGQKVVTFWLDMWVDKDARVDRVKVEPQLWTDEIKDWIVYPMEVRVQEPVVPAMKVTYTPDLPLHTAAADAVVWGAVRAAACSGSQEKIGPAPAQLTARDLLHRNVLQHMALASDKAKLSANLAKAIGAASTQGWCAKPATPAAGPEWYLRLRDLVYKDAGAQP